MTPLGFDARIPTLQICIGYSKLLVLTKSPDVPHRSVQCWQLLLR